MEAPLDIQKLIKEHGRQDGSGKPDANGNTSATSTDFDVQNPFPAPKLTVLTPKMTSDHGTGSKAEPLCPPGAQATFMPNKAPATHATRLQEKARGQRQGTIFDRDDRSLFLPQGYPWSIIGKVRTAGGFGTGTIVGPKHVLTASHCANWNADGTLGWISFTPGYYDGHGPQGEIPVLEVLSYEHVGHTATDLEVAFDYAILVLGTRIGDTLGVAGARSYDASWNGKPLFQYIGYPGELSRGERPYIQNNCIISTKEDHTLNGNQGCALGNFNDFTPGDSGGPCWGFWPNEPGPSVIGVGSIIGSTTVEHPGSTATDNDYGGGPALLKLVNWARANRV
jgi:V8-like Glu-specific endopeptidase